MKQITSSLLLCTLIHLVAQAQNIPDTNFANAIRNQCPTCIDVSNNLLPPATTLVSLDVSHQVISNLDGIEGFTNLDTFAFDNNDVITLPTLPNNLRYLSGSNNHLMNLPTFPNSIRELHLSDNILFSLPALPTNLKVITCRYNFLTSFPNIPSSAIVVDCSQNRITSLPPIPGNLVVLSCYNNFLTNLPLLSDSLRGLICYNNQLTSIPDLPDSLTNLLVSGNPNLTCLPVLPKNLIQLQLDSTGISCLPNLPLGLTNPPVLPFCVSYNPSLCPLFSQLRGNVYIDYDNDCDFTEGNDSTVVGGVLVKATDAQNNEFYTYTNAFGVYTLIVPVNQYTIEVLPQPTFFYAPCAPTTVDIVRLDSVVTVNLGMEPLVLCPLLEVEIESIRLRRCMTGDYSITYRNRGTTVANNAYIDVQLDTFLTYVSNSLNLSSTDLGNHTQRIFLGDIDLSAEGHFTIQVNVSCNSQLGQVHCTEAHIYPDTICGLNWTGPVIEILDSCLNDSVLFRLTNTGSPMLSNQNYQIIEDNVVYRPSTSFQLNGGESLDITIPAAPNKVYRIEAMQAANYPTVLGDAIAWAVAQNCNGISNTTVNFLNLFYTNHSALVISSDCSVNIGSYDPNAKSAQQIGYGNQHFIDANTPLEYKIEFQNTGTDTAFRVVVLDTLDTTVLDITSIQMGTSSHRFSWTLLENYILKFTFSDILLVDSFTNEAGSHGFVTFNIKQQADLAEGTVINNKAAIYFDFNAPVITNTCFHTIGTDFVVVSNNRILIPNAAVKVYPNPFEHYTTFEVSNVQYQQLTLKIRDVLGNEVTTLQSSNDKIQLERHHLASGVYLYQLYADDTLLNTGKIIAQ